MGLSNSQVAKRISTVKYEWALGEDLGACLIWESFPGPLSGPSDGKLSTIRKIRNSNTATQ